MIPLLLCKSNTEDVVFCINSDQCGSRSGGQVILGSPDDPLVIATICIRGAKYTYLHIRRKAQFSGAWARKTLWLFSQTVCLSICNALINNSLDLDTFRVHMAMLKPPLTVQWTLGHCKNFRNEFVRIELIRPRNSLRLEKKPDGTFLLRQHLFPDILRTLQKHARTAEF